MPEWLRIVSESYDDEPTVYNFSFNVGRDVSEATVNNIAIQLQRLSHNKLPGL